MSIRLLVSTDGSGNIATIKQHLDNVHKEWDVIIPGNFGGDGHTDLLFYKRSTGEGLFASTDGSGNIATIKDHLDWDKDWDVIIPGNFGGNDFTDLLFYKRSTGEGLFASTDGSGNIATIKDHLDWDKDWNLIIPGNFGGNDFTDLLFYKRSTGEGLFASTDGSGNIATIKDHLDWDKDWNLIIPGNFGGNDFTDLLLHSTRRFPPQPPTKLRVTKVTAGRIDVSWNDNSENEDGFRVRFRGKREGLSDHSGTTTHGRNVVTASLTNLLTKYEYTISVVAFNAVGQSQSSNKVRASTPNVPQTFTVSLRREIIVEGSVPYLGQYPPAIGAVPPGRLLKIRFPQSGPTVDRALSFVKRGHSTAECNKPNAVVVVKEGETVSPEQITAIYGVPQPKYSSQTPIFFLACLEQPISEPLADSVNIEITIMED